MKSVQWIDDQLSGQTVLDINKDVSNLLIINQYSDKV